MQTTRIDTLLWSWSRLAEAAFMLVAASPGDTRRAVAIGHIRYGSANLPQTT